MQLTEVDQDGAVQEAFEGLPERTRLGFLRGAAGALGGGIVLAATVGTGEATATITASRPPRRFGPLRFASGDTGILQYALMLEYLEAEFYAQATKNGIADGEPATGRFLEVVTHDERLHVTYLKRVLGRRAPKKPRFDFGTAVTDLEKFKTTSLTLESTGVGAYMGQAGNLRSGRILRAATSILTIEARHAGAIAAILGSAADDLTPNGAFDRGLSARGVLTAVKATDFIPALR